MDTMIATRALRDAGVLAKMIPLPADVQSSANLGLSIEDSAEVSAIAAIKSTNLALGGIVRQ